MSEEEGGRVASKALRETETICAVGVAGRTGSAIGEVEAFLAGEREVCVKKRAYSN